MEPDMKKYQAIASTYRCKRAKTDGLIQVFNEHSYVMAEYNDRTGVVRWLRVVLATQKASVEQWLAEQYPVQAHKPAAVAPATATRVRRKA